MFSSVAKLKLNCHAKHPWNETESRGSRTISFEAIPPVIYSEKKQRQKIRISRVGLRLEEEEAQLQGVGTWEPEELPTIKHIIITDH